MVKTNGGPAAVIIIKCNQHDRNLRAVLDLHGCVDFFLIIHNVSMHSDIVAGVKPPTLVDNEWPRPVTIVKCVTTEATLARLLMSSGAEKFAKQK